MNFQNSSDPFRAQLYSHLKNARNLEHFTLQPHNGNVVIAISRSENAIKFIDEFRSRINGHSVEIIDQTSSFLVKGKSAKELLDIVKS